jgi:hypothetical protein
MEMSGQLHSLAALLPEKEPGTHMLGGWVGPRAGLDVVGKRKSLACAGNRTPVVQPVARREAERTIPASRTEPCLLEKT